MSRVKMSNNLQDLQNLIDSRQTDVVVKKPTVQVKKVEKPIIKEIPKPKLVIIEEPLIPIKEPIKYDAQSKEEYQEQWKKNKYQHRKMVSKKNRKWLTENSENSDFKPYVEFPNVYEFISQKFEDEKSRKWILHLITNFLPLNRARIVPKLPSGRNVCPLTELSLTDVKNIVLGDREKYLAFTGEKTTIVLSGIAVQELNRFVLDYTQDFDTVNGHIINYAIDDLRKKSQK